MSTLVWRQELKSPNPQPTLPGMTSFTFLVSFPIWEFYFDICEWRILPAHTWTPALMLHLTNPCAKWKVLSLTKPKGKICKTKSLSNYITPRLDSMNINRSYEKKNGFTLKKGKNQTISHRNYNKCRLQRWSSISNKYTCPCWIFAA